MSNFASLDPQLKLKIRRVEAKAREMIASIRLSEESTDLGGSTEAYKSILKHIGDDSEKIAMDMLRFAEEKIRGDPARYLTLNSYEVFREMEEEWLKKHGIPFGWRDIQLMDPETWRKIEEARQKPK